SSVRASVTSPGWGARSGEAPPGGVAPPGGEAPPGTRDSLANMSVIAVESSNSELHPTLGRPRPRSTSGRRLARRLPAQDLHGELGDLGGRAPHAYAARLQRLRLGRRGSRAA